VLETGSAGIFGLCKKKAHIRVQRKESAPVDVAQTESVPSTEPEVEPQTPPAPERRETVVQETPSAAVSEPADEPSSPAQVAIEAEEPEADGQDAETDDSAGLEPPSEAGLAAIRADLQHLLTLMGLPSEVEVRFEDNTVHCHITGPHEEQVVGAEGRTLDSLQYLLRKMVASHLPDRIMLALNAGDFRERRAEELKVKAVELADLVKADGKTQSIPALNPSERRVVHMVLQEDKGVRSRSVGEGLFKKVLIYKPGKGRRPAAKKRRGGQGGRSSGD